MNKRLINKYFRKFGFEIHGKSYMQRLELSSNRIDAFIKQKEILGNKVSIIFDIGANCGDTVLKYHTLYPNAEVYAFEPFPATFKLLAEKVKGIDGIFPVECAISDINGKTKFYINNNADTNSLLESKKMGLNSDKMVENRYQIQVDNFTITEFCNQNKIGQVDILKLDIQGGELKALFGCEQMLKEKRIKLIYAETYFRQQYVGQPLFHEISNYLEGLGYFIQDIYDPYYGNGSLAWCDSIFLPYNSLT